MNSSATSLDGRLPLAKRITRGIKRAFRTIGFDVARARPDNSFRLDNPDITDFEWQTWMTVAPYTMGSLESVVCLVRAVEYIIKSNVPGDIVECGVWRGGAAMAIAIALRHYEDSSRNLYLYDTFAGMPQPGRYDVDYEHKRAEDVLGAIPKRPGARNIWAYATRDDFECNLRSVGYPQDRIRIVEGRVEETLAKVKPERIAILRLDTDWYESTKYELEQLYPCLVSRGILIADDYGSWLGSRKAVDEYFGANPPFLFRADTTNRITIKL